MSPRKLLLTVDRSVNAVAFPFSAKVRTATTHFFADPYVLPKANICSYTIIFQLIRNCNSILKRISLFPQFQCLKQIFQMHLFFSVTV